MADWRDEVLLEGEFRISTKKRIVFKVTLTPVGLYYSPITSSSQYEEKSVRMSDVVGCQCSQTCSSPAKSQCQSYSAVAAFTVFSYPFRKKVFSGKRTRHRQVIVFEINAHQTFEENWKICRKWRSVICCLARDMQVRPDDVDTCVPPPRRRLLILVNPFSGPGRALQIFKKEVAPMLEEANVPYKLVVTEYAGHAQDMVQNLELSDWGGLVIVSGDGLIFEVINGLMKRTDWSSAIKTPLGCVPGGSGNALACSINYSAGEPIDVGTSLHSTFIIAKHRVLPMDLVVIQTPTQQYFSFLSVTWGIVADIDFESEKYRNLGEARFTFGAIKRIANLRSYQGRLSFLPVAQYTPKTSSKPRTLVKLRRFSLHSSSSSCSLGSHRSGDSSLSRLSTPAPVLTNFTTVSNQPSGGLESHSNGNTHTPHKGNGDIIADVCDQSSREVETIKAEKSATASGKEGGEVSLDVCTNNVSAVLGEEGQGEGRPSSADVEAKAAVDSNYSMVSVEESTHHQAFEGQKQVAAETELKNSIPREMPDGVAELNEPEVEEEIFRAKKKDGQAVPTTLLPPLVEPVPENWVVIEDKFVLACALYQTHLGSEMLGAPAAHMADGVIHLMFVRDGISRNHLLSLFLAFSEGTHVNSPYVEIVPVLAFRLEPCETSGNIMIDGERLDPMPLQGQVLPSIGRIMGMK